MNKITPDTVAGKPSITAAFAVLSAVFWILSLLIFLHEQEILIISWDTIPVEHFRHETGNAWFARFAHNAFTSPSRAVLLENGTPLRRANAASDAVAYIGEGRYCLSNDELLFSTSDNSDPAKNGRKYELLCAAPVNHTKVHLLFFLAVLSSAITAVATWGYGGDLHLINALKSFGARHKKAVDFTIAAVSVVIVVVPYLITRLPYFLYYPVVLIRPDSYGYFDVAIEILSGQWPDLSLRTPGYAMFIATVFLFSKTILSVIAVQNLLSLISALAFVYGIFISYRYMAPLAAFAMAGFITSHVQMAGDIALLSESLYVSVIVCAFAFMAIALKRWHGVFFALAGAAFAFTVYIRPAGLFVVGVFVLVIVYIRINGRNPRGLTAAFALPFLSMLLVLGGYNYVKHKSFTLDNYGVAATVSNAIFLEGDENKYPRGLNAAVAKIRGAASAQQRVFLNSTWDIRKYGETLSAIHSGSGGDGGVIGPISEALGNPPANELRQALTTLLSDAIRKHPLQFIKKTFIYLLIYFDNSRDDYNIYNSINGSYSSLYIKANADAMARYLNPHPLPYFTVETGKFGGNRVADAGEYVETPMQWFHYLIYTKLQHAVFRSLFWVAAFAIAYAFSAFSLIRSGWKNMGSFILFTIGSATMLHAIGVAVAAFPNPRYSYTMEFSYYLLPLLLPICKHGKFNNAEPCEYRANAFGK
ncbi:hypothetical protein [Candidatus Magnetominusculus dajiuhuensis]|uniref:hypothetical protein n=1 Tax=Candidatus Magnetominusculus dajiuhuensis TaxID=3137712 RepID=UPI003B436359